MTDPTTTPTPAETRQGAPLARIFWDAWLAAQDQSRADQAGAGINAVLAAVSAAAPDERVCYSDECGEPCQSWQAMKRAEIEHLRRENATIARRLGEARAALAARPAPAVSGDVRVEWGARIEVGEHFGNVTPLPSEEAAREWVAFLNQDGNKPLRTLVRRTVTDWTVADAPAAEPEQAPERLCANCGHVEGVHACTFAAIRCAMCGCTAFRPAADDEGGQE